MPIFPASANDLSFPFLTVILFLPAAGGLVCLLTEDVRLVRLTATVTVLLEFLLSAILLGKFQIEHVQGVTGWSFQFADKTDWISSLGISYWLGVDGVSVFLVTLAALIMGTAIIAGTFMIEDRTAEFLTLMLVLETAVMGVFMSENLFLFFVFWEAMLIPMYFLMGMWGEAGRVRATTKFVVYTIFGSFLMLVAIFYLYSVSSPHTLDMAGSQGLIAQFGQHPLSSTQQIWLFLAFAVAFAIKLPIFPFHTWAPAAYTESPVPVVIALAGILSKAGAFGFIRYCLPLFPQASRDLQGLLFALCAVGMIYAAGLALVQTDMKRIVAYASISHVNLIALGIFSLNSTGLDGAVLQIINHSIIITGLFLAVAYIASRSGTRTLSEMGGMCSSRPILMWLFFVFVLAGLDLPGLGSFSGEFLILAGVFEANAWISGVAALTVILAAWYMIRFFQDTMNGPVAEPAAPPAIGSPVRNPTPYQFPVWHLLPGDLSVKESLLFVPLAALIIYIGIKPETLTTRINGTTLPLSHLVQPSVSVNQGGGGR